MPLLRGQVRAARARRAALLATAGLGLAGGVVLALVGGGEGDAGPEGPELESAAPEAAAAAPREAPEMFVATEPEAPEVPEVPEVPAPAPTIEDESGARRFETTFGQARGFRPALLAAGLSDDESAALEVALAETLDFRRCRPEQRIVYERAPDGRLLLFEYHDQPTSFVRAVWGDDGQLRAERVERELEVRRIARGGTVRTSLGDAIEAAGLGRGVVGVFIEVFDGKVNFSTQARAGDRFRVVVDEERLEGRFLRWGQVRAIEYVGARAGRLRAFYFEERPGRGDWFDEDGRQLRGSWLRIPCRYDRISSPYNPRRMHPILRRIVPHNGVDFAASTGTPVWAAADGVVSWAGPKGPNGNLVSIRHEGGWESHYAHLHRIQRGIRRGVRVEQRQLIGSVGSTGRSTGPHLHFGLKHNGRFTDPMAVLNGPGRLLPPGPRGRFRRERRRLEAALAEVSLGAAPTPEPDEPQADEGLD